MPTTVTIEYFDRWRQVCEGTVDDLGLVPGQMNKIMDAYTARFSMVRKYAWAVPDEEALQRLLDLGPIVEVGAGGGYWAMLLREMGGDVIAYDTAPPDVRENIQALRQWTKVQRGPASSAKKHPDRALFLCWPPYNTPMAVIALRAYLDAGGTTLAYIGEGYGGCTGSDSFHDMVEEQLVEREVIRLPQWPGIHDRLFVYEILDPGKENA